jgi:hypothetical protein
MEENWRLTCSILAFEVEKHVPRNQLVASTQEWTVRACRQAADQEGKNMELNMKCLQSASFFLDVIHRRKAKLLEIDC